MKRLQEARAEGHISHERMDERLDRVLGARTRGELEALASLRSRRAEDPDHRDHGPRTD